jgi:HAD superfamily hydrolase (TIGR01450 family)
MTSIDRLKQVQHVAVDLDGTLYRGSTLFPETGPFLDLLARLGVGCSFVTNNSSRSTSCYVAHLRDLGIRAEAADIYTSTHATVEYLRRQMPNVHRLFVLGTSAMQEEITECDFTLCGDDPEDEPDAVVVGFDMGLTYQRLCRAAYWINAEKPFIATHPDRICPTNLPTVLVDCGAICAALECATGRKPRAIPGKPDRLMLDGLIERYAVGAHQLAMVGDRLYTDMAMAHASGALGVLVLTGETTAAQAAESPLPDLVVNDLYELGQLLSQAKQTI